MCIVVLFLAECISLNIFASLFIPCVPFGSLMFARSNHSLCLLFPCLIFKSLGYSEERKGSSDQESSLSYQHVGTLESRVNGWGIIKGALFCIHSFAVDLPGVFRELQNLPGQGSKVTHWP